MIPTAFFRGASRGQGEAFNLLVGAILGLLILGIVIGVIETFNRLECEGSAQKLKESYHNAIQLPTGAILEEKNLRFCAGTSFSNRQFALEANLPDACVRLDAPTGSVSIVNEAPTSVSFRQASKISVYYKCIKGEDPAFSSGSGCRESCTISIGKSIAP